jgi:hypothetical protein
VPYSLLNNIIPIAMNTLQWKQFLTCLNNVYADAVVDGNSLTYYVSESSNQHPIPEYRNKWTADINGCTLYEYRPAKTPIFFPSKEEAHQACERDLIALHERWNAMCERANKNPKEYVSFANLS